MAPLHKYALFLSAIICIPLHAAEPAAATVRLVFAGDIMLDDGPGREVAKGVDPFADFAKTLLDADFTIGNLECVIATGGERIEKPYNFRADPRGIPLLLRYFDAVSVANNHSGDFGPEALTEQLDRLDRAKLKYFGGGRNLAEAHQPLVIELGGIRIAVLGYNEFKPRSFEAGPMRAGVAWSVDEQVVADIKLARTKHRADLVIPFMHWGFEEEPDPNDRQREFSRKMIDAGADVVVGGHPHITQGAEYYKGHLIVYSLGNFVFDGFSEGPCRIGWLLRLTLGKSGLVEWDTRVAHADEQGIPHPLRGAKSPRGRAGTDAIEMHAAD
ncbi:MAG: CapA family protein [Planctomycetia bacterium]|nr:CapA family protein [Planctomycetia bacterium]